MFQSSEKCETEKKLRASLSIIFSLDGRETGYDTMSPRGSKSSGISDKLRSKVSQELRHEETENHFENLIVNFIKGLFHVFNILDQVSKECRTYQGPDKFQKWWNKVK